MELLLPSLAFALRKSYFPVVSRIGLLLFMSQLDVSLNVCFFFLLWRNRCSDSTEQIAP